VDLFAVDNDEDAALYIFQRDIDILIDLTAHTYHGRIGIGSRRPAKLVANYLGYPGTTGCRQDTALFNTSFSRYHNL
jgi:predicted O-linked N-acetylglucosamine transferase (SPINDLY family)